MLLGIFFSISSSREGELNKRKGSGKHCFPVVEVLKPQGVRERAALRASDVQFLLAHKYKEPRNSGALYCAEQNNLLFCGLELNAGACATQKQSTRGGAQPEVSDDEPRGEGNSCPAHHVKKKPLQKERLFHVAAWPHIRVDYTRQKKLTGVEREGGRK